MNILFLRGFNNYFNRIVKTFYTLDDYRNNAVNTVDYSQINFNPNDGVATELIIGGPTQLTSEGKPLDWDKTGTPDYAVCYEGDTIISRWYVLESERTREGQYRLALKRDVIAENLDNVLLAPCYVEKGLPKNSENPLLYNNENMTYNQIKTNEYLLKDSTNVPWVVGYAAKNMPDNNTTEATGAVELMITETIDPSELPWEFDLSTNPIINNGVSLRLGLTVGNVWAYQSGQGHNITVHYQSRYGEFEVQYDNAIAELENPTILTENVNYINSTYYLTYYTDSTGLPSESQCWNCLNDMKSKVLNFSGNAKAQLLQQLRSDFSEAANALAYKDKIIFDSDNNKYYKIKVQPVNTSGEFVDYNVPRSITDLMWTDFKPSGTQGRGSASEYNYTMKIQYSSLTYRVSYVEITQQVIKAPILQAGDSNRGSLNNAVFDMFCIPYGELNIVDDEDNEFTTDADCGMAIGRGYATALGMDSSTPGCYDLQLLPYCPIQGIREMYEAQEYIDLGAIDEKYWSICTTDVEEDPVPVSVIFWATSASGTIDIPVQIESSNNILEKKIENETKVCRLCSPNYAGMFEFSLAKNNGIDYINIDYNYRPYNPYIHANPNFKGLYGTDWNDARGLICAGDFTISSVSDAWANYQIQNKNYQVIFDRQIQNMDVNNRIALEQQQFNAVAGTLTGGITGGVGGAIAGSKAGPYGAIAGAIVGGLGGTALSAAGASLDREWLKAQQQENKSYAIDMFGYQLGNIQALPYNLSRTDSLTENNKLWPFIEIYEATETEKNALRQKIKYNGMTIMAIDTLSNYLNISIFDRCYLKGQLIDLSSIVDDFHIADDIYKEVNKGFYILGGNYVSTTSNE